jgi:hypothetical protein
VGEIRKRVTYGEESSDVEAEKHVCIVEEVADAYGSWWTGESGYQSANDATHQWSKVRE